MITRFPLRLHGPAMCGALCLAAWVSACSDAGSNPSEAAPRLELDEELRIGSIDDPEYAFGWIRALALGPDGNVYTLHGETQEIRVHDEAGRLVRRLGGAGEGPGEFKSAGMIGFLADTLWVFDYGAYRITYFDAPSGTLIESVQTPVDLGDGSGEDPPRPFGLLPDGTMLGRTMAWSRLVARGEVTESVMFRWTRDGELIDTLAVQSLENSSWEVAPPDGSFGSYTSQPFGDAAITTIAPTMPRVLHVDRSAPRDDAVPAFRVTLRTFDHDTLFDRRFPYDPVPLEAAMVDSVVAERAEALHEWQSGVSVGRAAEWARAGLYVPDLLPPVESALVGMDGTVWLRLTDDGAGPHRWLGLAPDGEILGELEAPREFRLMTATRDRWWGVLTDELDVPYIIRYAVAPAATETELAE